MAVVPDSTVTAAQLAPRIGANNGVTDEVTRIWEEAKILVADIFAGAWRDVPLHVVNECVYRVGRGIKDATNKASNGAGQVTAGDAQPLRAPADPLTSSYPLIRRYVVLGI